jgi:hypothetical protein
MISPTRITDNYPETPRTYYPRGRACVQMPGSLPVAARSLFPCSLAASRY